MKHPKAPSEAQVKHAIKDYLRAKRILYIQINQIRPVHKPDGSIRFIPIDIELLGAPDILIPAAGSIAVEIKSSKGVLSDNQRAWNNRATEWGIKCHVVRSLEDLEDILNG